ncbi:MAG: hypothetical protein M1281_20550, partial [Chloroflexi bacterium]|nr:hypothetical protein [Chloroflexota bacterium]
VGKRLRPGQRVRFLYLRGEPGVQAWDLPDPPATAALDYVRYRTLLLRAASTILQPLGLDERTLRDWVLGRAIPVWLPGMGAEEYLRAGPRLPVEEVVPIPGSLIDVRRLVLEQVIPDN